MMITLYTSSLWIGGIFGFVVGVAISFFSVYLADRNTHDRFSNGWDAGVRYGKSIKNETDDAPNPDIPICPINPDITKYPYVTWTGGEQTVTNTTSIDTFTPVRDRMTGRGDR